MPTRTLTRSGGTSDGPAVDRSGAPVIDPTKNVADLVDAAIVRQDDLRIMSARYDREIRDLRASYEDKLRVAESARIDAIRAVDVGAVQQAAAVQAQQATILAAQVTTSAETLRNQVAASALAAATAQATALAPIQKSIEDLRQAQYQQQGEKTSKSEGSAGDKWIIGIGLTLVGVLTTLAPHIKIG